VEPAPLPRLNLLRELSEQAVLEMIFREGPITRPEIAAHTGLSKPTVSDAVRRLVHARLVHPAGRRSGRPGRTPVCYAVDAGAGFVVGVDLGGTNLRVAATDIYGEVIVEERRPTGAHDRHEVVQQIVHLVRRAVQAAEASHGRLLSLAISTPGVVDPATDRIRFAYNVVPDGELDLTPVVADRFGVPVLVENNVNVAAVGEKWRGLATGVPTFVFIAVGAGVGMGTVVEDQLVRGAHGAAGEIAYLPLAADPFDRRHRVHGGLEDEAGASGILASLRADEGWEGTPPDSVEAVFELAAQGHRAAQAVVESEGRRIGLAIAAACAVVDPALVVLGGGIGSNEALLAPVRETVAGLVPLVPRIETSLLGEKAALYGAVAIALRHARDALFAAPRDGRPG
jgi:predicted NBD/HSP70 family sugar kinase